MGISQSFLYHPPIPSADSHSLCLSNICLICHTPNPMGRVPQLVFMPPVMKSSMLLLLLGSLVTDPLTEA